MGERERRLGIGVLTLMFAPSASYLNASVGGWWIRAWRGLVNKEGMRPGFSAQ